MTFLCSVEDFSLEADILGCVGVKSLIYVTRGKKKKSVC